MEPILILTEGISDQINNYIETHDDDEHHLHIYNDFVSSSEGNLFYALGEVFLNILDVLKIEDHYYSNDERAKVPPLKIITDLPKLAEELTLLYGDDEDSLVEVIQMGVNSTNFFPTYSREDLINYELSVLISYPMAVALNSLWQIMDADNLVAWTTESEKIRKARESKDYFGDSLLIHLLDLMILEITEDTGEYAYSFIQSLKMQISKNPIDLADYLKGLDKYTTLSPINGFFIWNQLKYLASSNKITNDDETLKLQNNLYTNCYNAFADACLEFTTPIMEDERRRDRIMVFVTQFLTDGHYPTELIKGLVMALNEIGYDIFIFNTTERYTPKGYVPMYSAIGGNTVREFQDFEKMICGNVVCDYYQPAVTSGYLDIFNDAINKAAKYKPLYILSIGNGSLISDVLDRMIPVASMDIDTTSLPTTKSRIRVITRPLEKGEKHPNIYTDGYTVVAPNFNYQINTVEDAMKVMTDLDRQIVSNLKDASKY